MTLSHHQLTSFNLHKFSTEVTETEAEKDDVKVEDSKVLKGVVLYVCKVSVALCWKFCSGKEIEYLTSYCLETHKTAS